MTDYKTSSLEKYGFTAISDFAEADAETMPAVALEKIKKIAPRFREKFIKSGQPLFVKQYLCSTSPYPTVYGFHTTYHGLNPYLFFNNRATLVQFEQDGDVKTLLFNPYFPALSAQAPFYAELNKSIPSFIPEGLFVKRMPSIIDQLAQDGILPEDIDYFSYDHLHVQDMRPLMGTKDKDGQWVEKPMFPNAKFIFPLAEWLSVRYLHPVVSRWYVADALDRVNEDSLLLYEGDLQLSGGVALMATPGHTPGNHSLYLNTDQGTFTISENGVGPDGYDPQLSQVAGVRDEARKRNLEVVLNANTLDEIFRQYNSMIKEKLLSGPNPQHPEFCNHRSSSEFTSWFANPGLKPTIELGAVEHGRLQQPGLRKSSKAG